MKIYTLALSIIIILLAGCGSGSSIRKATIQSDMDTNSISIYESVTLRAGTTGVEYEWYDENGNLIGEQQTLNKAFDTEGIHKVTLKITTEDGEILFATINITVSNENTTTNPTNRAPIAKSDSIVLTKNSSKEITLLAEDKDNDMLNYTITIQPKHGKLIGNAPYITYKPNKDYVGYDRFSFKANDGSSDSQIATVDIKVQGYKIATKKNTYSNLTYTYDTRGNLVKKHTSYSTYRGNIITYTYDTNDNMLKKSYDYNADGKIDYQYFYTYNKHNDLLKKSYDSNADGIIDSEIDCYSYTYDDNGKVLEKIITSCNKSNQFTKKEIYTYTYDQNANLITKVYKQYAQSYNYKDQKEGVYTYTYDQNNNLIKESYKDSYYDYKNYTFTYEYDENNNLIKETKKSHPYYASHYNKEAIYTYEYDENSNLITETYESFTNYSSYVYKTQYTYTYDENGNLLEENYDLQADGDIESTTTYTWIQI